MIDLTAQPVLNKRIKPILVLSDSPVYDVLIVGAGVAGASLAWYLGKQGIKVVVIERDFSEPEKIIGELLQPGGVLKLEELGYKDVLNGFDAQRIDGYALFMNEQHFEIPYPEAEGIQFKGRGFRYGKFISKLRSSLNEIPSVTLIEGSVNELLEDEGTVNGVRYQSKEEGKEKIARAHLTVICDGGFSKFRDGLNDSRKQVKGFMLGLLLKNCELPYPNHGHVFLGGASPFLSYPVSSTETRVLIDFPGGQPPKKNEILHQYLTETIYRQLPAQMQKAFIAALEEDKFKAMPNAMVAAKPIRKPGVVMLGDSLNMRHPLTGGGMTAALTDVHLLGNLLFEINGFNKQAELSSAVNEFYNRRHMCNATINILADALYDVMSYPDLKEACYAYLKKGNGYVETPISILSAISRDKDKLIRKFFSVAMFGAGNLVRPFPSPKRVARAYNLLRKSVHIISPLLMNEHPSTALKVMVETGKWVFPKTKSGILSNQFNKKIKHMQTTALHKNGSQVLNGLALLFADKGKITACITDSLQSIGNAKIREASAHLFSAGGKMLRSSLVTTCYKAVGGWDSNKILPVAAAIELIHNWSLVHDDIIDKSATRRGVATVHEKWGSNTAILTGDALNNLVYLLIARSDFHSESISKVMEFVADANLQLIDGELMDIDFETRNDVTEKDYFEMIGKKTGALIKYAAKIGALLGTDNPSHIHAIETYGDKIGIAFQIKDDLLDLTADEEETGKDFAGDIKEGKKTLLLLHALSHTIPTKAKRLREITTSGAASPGMIQEAIDIMRQAGSFEYAQRILTQLILEAKQNLLALPNSNYVRALSELAEFIGQPEKIKVEYPLYTI